MAICVKLNIYPRLKSRAPDTSFSSPGIIGGRVGRCQTRYPANKIRVFPVGAVPHTCPDSTGCRRHVWVLAFPNLPSPSKALILPLLLPVVI